MRLGVALATLRDLRRGFAWWSIGVVGMVALQVSVYPTVRNDTSYDDLLEGYPEAFQDLFGFGAEQLDYTSAVGYLGIELFSLVVPLVLIIAAVATGAAAIAGEEDRGTLDLLMSMPVGRRRVTAEKLLAMAAEVVGLGLVLLVALWIGVRVIDMEVSFAHLAAAVLGAVLLAIAAVAATMAVDAVDRRDIGT